MPASARCGRMITFVAVTTFPFLERYLTEVDSFPLQLFLNEKRIYGINSYFCPKGLSHRDTVVPLMFPTPFAMYCVDGFISNCPQLHFPDYTSPITLRTDASDFGVGGVLFQTIDGIENPIAFVSKSLTEIQLRWSVI